MEEKYKKFNFGVSIPIIGLLFAAFIFIYAVLNPWIYNRISGLLGSFLAAQTLLPFIISVMMMTIGFVICQ